MEKSESELLEEWTLVSSVYDTEQENSMAEMRIDAQTATNTTDSNADLNGNGVVMTKIESSAKCSEDDSKETTDNCSETPVICDTEQTVEAVTVSGETGEIDSVTKQMTETDITEQVTSADNNVEEIAVECCMEQISESAVEETKVDDVDQISVANVISEETEVVATEQICAVSEEITSCEPIAVSSEKSTEIEVEETCVADTSKVMDEKIIESDAEKLIIAETEKNETDAVTETDVSIENNVDNIEDNVVNSSLDSSMEHIQIEHCEGSCVQNVPELIPDLAEQEIAAIESSSSDIDIIDENVEESITSSFIHPLSLSISSSVDTSSILTTPSEGDKEVKTEQKTEEVFVSEKTKSHSETSPSYSESSESYVTRSESLLDRSDSYFQRSRFEDRDENVRPEPQRQRQPPNIAGGIYAGILEFIRSMTRFEWSLLGGVVFCLYITVVFNETNIFAVEKENVASQMKQMIDELKHDNKLLRDQMLSEMKNEKVFSTFEHQIKELKKENSKLNHMLFDVAKVLEEQKDTQKRIEKREADYIAPFKHEINNLKEHINILKFDNEELQKQLVRMRYAKYSQGEKYANDEKSKEQKDETKTNDFGGEIHLDLNSLKKWNELITLLSKELGLSESESLKGDKSHSKANNFSSYWKAFLQEFKGTFKDFKANVTSVISDYRKANEKAVSEIYNFVKDFFTVQEESNQKYVPPGEESSQWNNIGDFVKDLSEKWTNIKDRIYTSDIKEFIKSFKSGKADDGVSSEKSRSTTYDYKEPKPTNAHYESERKSDKAAHQSDSDDSKWMFKRAELRAELRENEKEEESDNWYLKRKKHTSQFEGEIKF